MYLSLIHIFKGFIGKADQISLQFSGVLFINPVNGLVAGIGDLFCILGNLDLRAKFSLLVLDCSQLVYAAERRAVLGGDKMGSHTPGCLLYTSRCV